MEEDGKQRVGANKVGSESKAFTTKPYKLSSIPGTHTLDKRTNSHKLPLTTHKPESTNIDKCHVKNQSVALVSFCVFIIIYPNKDLRH